LRKSGGDAKGCEEKKFAYNAKIEDKTKFVYTELYDISLTAKNEKVINFIFK